jgi:ribosomal protein S6
MQDRTYTYEGLFLFPQSAVADLQGAADHVLELLNRAGAEIISFKKWDERRLAYEVEGNKMLRSLITRADHVLPEIMQAAEGRQQLADEIKLRATQPAAVLAAQETAPAAPEPDIDEEEDFVVAVDEV